MSLIIEKLIKLLEVNIDLTIKLLMMTRKVIIVLLVLFASLLPNAWGQEKFDAEGPILGGFIHDNTSYLILSYRSKIKMYPDNAFFIPAQDHQIAVIDVYSVVGWVCTYSVGKCIDCYYYSTFPSGIYFIKVGEQIKVLYVRYGDRIDFLLV